MKTLVNLLASCFNIAASVVAMLALLPIIQSSLGVAAYGYVAVALSFVNTSTIVSVAITSMSARFIAVEAKRSETNLLYYFNSILVACLLLSIIIITVFIYIAHNIQNIMKVDDSLVDQVRILLIVLSVSLSCSIIKTPFTAGLCYSNSLYVDYLFTGMSQLARVIAPIILFPLINPSIWVPYAGALFVDVCSILFYSLTYRKYLPNIRIDIKYFRMSTIKNIVSSGIWVSVSKSGAVLLSTLSLYLANIYVGSYDAGVFSSIVQLQSFMSVLTTAVTGVCAPHFFRSYTEGIKEFTSTVLNMSRIGNILLGVSFGLVFSLSAPFLRLWMNTDVSPYGLVIAVLIGYPIIAYPLEFMNQVFITTNSVRFPAVVTLIFGIGNIVLASIACSIFDLGILGIAFAQAICMILRNIIVLLPKAANVLQTSFRNVLREYLCCSVTGIITISATTLFAVWIKPTGWLDLIATAITSLVVSLAIIAVLIYAKDKPLLVEIQNLIISEKKGI